MRLDADVQSVGFRIHIYMSVNVSAVWHEVLKTKAADCGPFLDDEHLRSQEDFVDAVERIAKEHKQRNIQQVLNKLGPAHSKVMNFAVEASRPFADELRPEQLLEPVWNIAFALIKKGLDKGLKLGDSADHITRLEAEIPHIEACESAIANVPELHKPLQEILARHVDSYLEVINLIGRNRETDVVKCLKESRTKFEHWKNHYVVLRRLATQVIRLPGLQETVPSDSFELVDDQPIGSRSTFAQVYAVREKGTRMIYAMKKIPSSASASSLTSPEDVINEIKIMRKLSHHHIAVLAFASKDDYGFKLYVMPRAECDLGHYLDLSNGHARYDRNQALQWFGCLLAALDYAHRNEVKHRDIKPENILIDDKGKRVFLTDFGLSRDFSGHENSMSTGSPPRGTDNYWAPECTQGGQRTTAVDIFALGCVFTEILGAIGGHSREIFRQKRKGWKNERFRLCLDSIRKEWLHDLKGEFPDKDKNGTPCIIFETKRMLAEEAEDRPDASSVLLQLKDAKYRCKYCSG